MSRIRWYRFAYIVCWPLCQLLYPHRVVGRENVPDGPCIICAPHSNALDPILISVSLGIRHYVRHLAKVETETMPFVGWFMKNCGSIFVRRGESDINAFKQCMRALKDGEKLMIFPEGTRVHGDAHVEPKNGAVRLAAKLHVPILPVYVPRDKKLFHPTEVIIGKPYTVEAAPHTDYEALARESMDRIWELRGA